MSRVCTDHMESGWITLNVGGQVFQTHITTLTNQPHTMLGRMFSEVNRTLAKPNPIDGHYYFDRSSTLFTHVLEFYRTHHLTFPANVPRHVMEDEYRYWGIEPTIVGDTESQPSPTTALKMKLGVSHEAEQSQCEHLVDLIEANVRHHIDIGYHQIDATFMEMLPLPWHYLAQNETVDMVQWANAVDNVRYTFARFAPLRDAYITPRETVMREMGYPDDMVLLDLQDMHRHFPDPRQIARLACNRDYIANALIQRGYMCTWHFYQVEGCNRDADVFHNPVYLTKRCSSYVGDDHSQMRFWALHLSWDRQVHLDALLVLSPMWKRAVCVQ